MDNLVGTAEIAKRLGVKRPQVVHDWIRRYKEGSEHPFPAPVAHLSKVMVWNWPDVAAWAKKTGRLPERSGV